MNRTFYDTFFSSYTENLSKEVTSVDDMKDELLRAMTANSTSDFCDSVVTSQYNVILNALQDKRGVLENQLKNMPIQKAYISTDDTSNANKLDSILDSYSSTRTLLAQKAEDVNDGANALAGGVVTLTSIVSLEELDVGAIIEENMGGITYDQFMSMSPQEQTEVVAEIILKIYSAIEDGTLEVPENGRIEVPIGPGIIAYAYYNTSSMTVGNEYYALDIDPESAEACAHVMLNTDLVGLDASINQSLQIQGKVTQTIDDHTSVYTAAGYNIIEGSFYTESGVSITSVNGTATISSTVASGVEIFPPSDWVHEPDYEQAVVAETVAETQNQFDLPHVELPHVNLNNVHVNPQTVTTIEMEGGIGGLLLLLLMLACA